MRKSSEFEIQPYRVNYKNTTPNDRIQASLMVVAAVYGLQGWDIGNRDLEVRLGDREILISRSRERGCPRVGQDIWETED